MTILHISGAITWRGGEQQLMYLWEELQSQGIQQHVLCPEGSVLLQRLHAISGASVFTYTKKGSLSVNTASILSKLCRTHTPDIIHVHDAHAHTTAFLSALLHGNKTPVVVSRRVDFPIGKSFLSKLKYNHHSIKQIICVSKAIKEIMRPDIKNQKVLKVVHSGIDLKRFPFKAKTGKLRSLLNIPDNVRIIGNTSALAPHKDYFTFVDTAQLLLNQCSDVHFVIMGTGPLENEVKNYIQQKKLEAHFSLTGFREDIPELLPDFDVFLMTSQTEGLGTSVLDAFACHVPVVTTRAGGIGEIVSHNENGLMASPGDSKALADLVYSILHDPSLCKKFTQKAQEILGHFSKTHTALKTREVYNKVITQN